MGFILGMQDWFNIQNSVTAIHHTNRLRKKNHRTLSKDVEKAVDEIQRSFMKKTLSKRGIMRNFLNLIKTIYQKYK